MEIKQNKIWFLHSLRGTAAILVVISHICFMFWYQNSIVTTAFNYIEAKRNEDYLIYFNIIDSLNRVGFNLGAFGVALFFLISGFVISLSLEKTKGWRFLVARFFRIYPVYIVGFSLTFCTIFLYTRFNGTLFPYNIQVYFANISLLRDWLWQPSVDGINWTLEAEIKFYLIACSIAFFNKLNNSKVIIMTGFAMCLFNVLVHNQYGILLNENFAFYKIVYNFSHSFISIIFMLIGICFYNLYQKHWTLKEFIVVLQVIFLLFILSVVNGPNTGIIEMYFVSYSLALLVFLNIYFLRDSFKYNAILNFLANISYPLYVVHGVNGYILMTVLDKINFNPYICIIITVSLSILIAWIMHIFIEKPMNNFGRKLVRKGNCVVVTERNHST